MIKMSLIFKYQNVKMFKLIIQKINKKFFKNSVKFSLKKSKKSKIIVIPIMNYFQILNFNIFKCFFMEENRKIRF